MRAVPFVVFLALTGAAVAQTPAQPASPGAAPGFSSPPAAAQPAPVAQPAAPAERSQAEVTKTAKPGRDVFIGSYLTLDKTCKVGERPTVTFTEQPKNGKVRSRGDSMNLAHAAGVPRNKCLGVSPSAIAVIYQGGPKFRSGSDSFAYNVKYPDGRERDVKVTVTIP